MTPPAFTVAVPCFNCAATIERCVRAILASAAAAEPGGTRVAEILLIDGGSRDATSDVCRTLAAAHPLVRVVEHPISSASAKRNAALRAAKGDYLLFTDPDCAPEEGWLAAMSAAAARGARCITGRVLGAPGTGGDEFSQGGTSLRVSAEPRVFSPGVLNRAFAFRAGSSNNLAIERELLAAVGGFPEDVGPGTPNGVAEDTEVLYLVLRRRVEIAYTPDAVVVHDHAESFEEFLAKKRGYAKGLNYFLMRRYWADPAAWISVIATAGYSKGKFLAGAATFNSRRIALARAELGGRWEGFRAALRAGNQPR